MQLSCTPICLQEWEERGKGYLPTYLAACGCGNTEFVKSGTSSEFRHPGIRY